MSHVKYSHGASFWSSDKAFDQRAIQFMTRLSFQSLYKYSWSNSWSLKTQAVGSSLSPSPHIEQHDRCILGLVLGIQGTASSSVAFSNNPSLHIIGGGELSCFIIPGESEGVVFNASKAHFFSLSSTESKTNARASIFSFELHVRSIAGKWTHWLLNLDIWSLFGPAQGNVKMLMSEMRWATVM